MSASIIKEILPFASDNPSPIHLTNEYPSEGTANTVAVLFSSKFPLPLVVPPCKGMEVVDRLKVLTGFIENDAPIWMELFSSTVVDTDIGSAIFSPIHRSNL